MHVPRQFFLALCVTISLGVRHGDDDLVHTSTEQDSSDDAKCVKMLKGLYQHHKRESCELEVKCMNELEEFLAIEPGTNWQRYSEEGWMANILHMFAAPLLKETGFVAKIPYLWSGFWGPGSKASGYTDVDVDSFDALDEMMTANEGYRLETTAMGAALQQVSGMGCIWQDDPPSRIKTLFQHASHLYAMAMPPSPHISVAMYKNPQGQERAWTDAIFNQIELPTLVARQLQWTRFTQHVEDDPRYVSARQFWTRLRVTLTLYTLKKELSCDRIAGDFVDQEGGQYEMFSRLKMLGRVVCIDCGGDLTPKRCLEMGLADQLPWLEISKQFANIYSSEYGVGVARGGVE